MLFNPSTDFSRELKLRGFTFNYIFFETLSYYLVHQKFFFCREQKHTKLRIKTFCTKKRTDEK